MVDSAAAPAEGEAPVEVSTTITFHVPHTQQGDSSTATTARASVELLPAAMKTLGGHSLNSNSNTVDSVRNHVAHHQARSTTADVTAAARLGRRTSLRGLNAAAYTACVQAESLTCAPIKAHQDEAVAPSSSPRKVSSRRTLMKPETRIKPVSGADIRNARIVPSRSPPPPCARRTLNISSNNVSPTGTALLQHTNHGFTNSATRAAGNGTTQNANSEALQAPTPNHHLDPAIHPQRVLRLDGNSNDRHSSNSKSSVEGTTPRCPTKGVTPTSKARVIASPAAPTRVTPAYRTSVVSPCSKEAAVIRMADLTKPTEPYGVKLAVTLQQKHIFKQAHNPKRIVDLYLTKYPLMREIAAEMGFVIEETEEECNAYQFNLCWSDTVLPLTRLVRLGNWQRTNHFPSMFLLCRKGHLGTTLAKMHRKLPSHFTFYPRTWHIRTERTLFTQYYTALKQKRLVKYFIIKPNSGCQGRGIMVTRDPLNAVEDLDNYIVQEYIHTPLLCEGRKFDLRIYVLLTSIREPSIFMFNEGLVRMCAEPYEIPNEDNVKHTCKHLTNYAVNKHSAEYVFNTDMNAGDIGNKRNFRFFNRWLEANGHSSALFWERTSLLIGKTIFAAQPQICQVYNSCFPRYNEGYTCFEVLGFDVLVDHKMKPWLMEINHTPSFMTDTPLDRDIKGNLIREVWDIIDCKADDMEKDRRREREEFTRRNMPPWAMSTHPLYATHLSQLSKPTSDSGEGVVSGCVNGSPTKRRQRSYVLSVSGAGTQEEQSDSMAAIVEKRRQNEDSKLKNFKRIYPSSKPEHQLIFDTIRNLAQAEYDTNSAPSTQPSGHFTYSPPLTEQQQQTQQERLRRELRDIANGIYNRRSAPVMPTAQPIVTANNPARDGRTPTPRSPQVRSCSGGRRQSTPVRPRTAQGSRQGTAVTLSGPPPADHCTRDDELASLRPVDLHETTPPTTLVGPTTLTESTADEKSVSPAVGGVAPGEVTVLALPTKEEQPLQGYDDQISVAAARLAFSEPSLTAPTTPAGHLPQSTRHAPPPNQQNGTKGKVASPRGSSHNSPMRPQLIEPTAEELERLETLQQQLDLEANADPLPPSEDEDYDFE